jgi:hypothetical protein
MVRVAEVGLKGISPMTQSKHYEVPRNGRESHSDYEKRTWRLRMHADDNGELFIPPMALKKALEGAASFLGKKVPGRGQKTYASFFRSTVLVMNPVSLGLKVDEVPGEELFVPSDGKAGGGTRVMKTFGRINHWSGTAAVYVLDETISKEVFEEHLKVAGQFIGLGMFRPERGGFFGRFAVEKVKWSEVNS